MKLLENIQAVRMLGKFQNYKKAKPIYTDLDALELTDDTDSSFDRIIQDENRLEVRRAINALPDYQKEVIILRFYHELKIREIAKITKASVPTVKSRLQQGLKKLQRYLTDFKGGESI